MQTFKKNERLNSFYHKELLFSRGKRFFVFPFGITYIVGKTFEENFKPASTEAELTASPKKIVATSPCKVLISAPKKLFKKAVERNKVKRLFKEAYRRNKSSLYTFLEEKQLQCLLSFVYSTDKILPYGEIEERVVVAINRLCEEIEKNYIENN